MGTVSSDTANREPIMHPFYSAHCPSLGWLYYFRSPAAAEAMRALHGGYVLETIPGYIWRLTLTHEVQL